MIGVVFLIKTNYDYKYAINNYGYSQGTIGKLGMEFNIAEGNLNVEIDCDTEDEIGALAESFKMMISNIKSYISEIDKVLGDISKGDLNTNTTSNYNGDFIDLKNSLDNIISSLNNVFYEIKESAVQVENGSGQVSESVDQINEGI